LRRHFFEKNPGVAKNTNWRWRLAYSPLKMDFQIRHSNAESRCKNSAIFIGSHKLIDKLQILTENVTKKFMGVDDCLSFHPIFCQY
jgi:hypothetical protein